MISIIVAISQNGVIGKGKELPWNYPEDLRYFKQVTSYHTVVMGRTTFEGIVSRLHQPLPNRHNVVVSKNPNWHYPNVTVVHDYQKFLKTPHPDEVLSLVDGIFIKKPFLLLSGFTLPISTVIMKEISIFPRLIFRNFA